ncbi:MULTISPECIES: L-aspartate oxidase [Bacillus]|uniref:L-aspartate oxidase n=1 Tax=Bacillus TaxID=1386 RepID=UPI000316F4A5|nr:MULTISPECIES: L-aspartate oxidase [Bacillus]
MNKMNYDVLLVGSGVAALQTALHASKTKKVVLLTKTNVRSSSTYLAQGGIAAVHAKSDHIASHLQDTIEAGRFHNNENAVHHLVSQGGEVVNELIAQGMQFDRDHYNQILYGLEGAHSKRRILHSKGDSTGKELAEFLINQAYSSNIDIRENEMVVDVILGEDGSCLGVYSMNAEGRINKYYASQTVLATGGCGTLYPFSTNGKNAIGDGFALALKAGARLKDMEFIQFHPTGLYIDGKVRGLVSEAVRGEGAKLVTAEGKLIMEGVHDLKDLAPRHVVAQTIFSYMNKGNDIYLDISSIDHFSEKFPTISSLCEQYGLNWKDGIIPVAPASHFIMGGVETNEYGQTNVQGLFAVGEVACTGVHGANRLASNSLLEGLVFGKDVGNYIQQLPKHQMIRMEQSFDVCQSLKLPNVMEMKRNMFKYVGIVRNEEGLSQMFNWLQQYSAEEILSHNLCSLTKEEVSTAFMLLTAICIVKSALLRKESRGGHFRIDYDMEKREWQDASIVMSLIDMEGSVVYEQVKA